MTWSLRQSPVLAGMAGPRVEVIEPGSIVVVGLTVVAGVTATLLLLRWADNAQQLADGEQRMKAKTSNRNSLRNSPDGRVPSILKELRAMGSERDRAGMARYGINIDAAFGVSVYELRKVAKQLGTDHDLALALWATGNHEARLLACFVDDPAKVTVQQMEIWANDFDSWDICDQATTSLFDVTKHAWSKAAAWAKRDEEWVKRGGFALMAGLAVHDKTANNSAFEKLFPLIERGAFDCRNFVKKAVNWALRNIGKRNLALHAAAITCAEHIREVANEKAGGNRGGDADTRSARWVASDALRELGSEKTLARLKKRK